MIKENIISDENLLKFYTHENLEEMTNLFSNGNFSEIINKFFLVAARSDSVNSSNLSERNQSGSSEKENPNPSANNSISKNANNNLPGTTDNNNNSTQNPSSMMFSTIINTPQSAVQSPYPSMSQRNAEFNYNIFERLNEDELTQQILLTIDFKKLATSFFFSFFNNNYSRIFIILIILIFVLLLSLNLQICLFFIVLFFNNIIN